MSNKILVVDDQRDITFILSTLLKFHKLDVITANSSKEVIDLFKNESIVCAVLDYMMPDKSGIELATEIRALHDDKSKIPIFLYTVKTLTNEELETINKLSVYYLKKPLAPNEFIKKITDVMRVK